MWMGCSPSYGTDRHKIVTPRLAPPSVATPPGPFAGRPWWGGDVFVTGDSIHMAHARGQWANPGRGAAGRRPLRPTEVEMSIRVRPSATGTEFIAPQVGTASGFVG